MYRSNMYAAKDYPCVSLTNDNGELKIDWFNDVHLIESLDYTSLILETELTSSEIDGFLEGFKSNGGSVELTFNAKTYDSGEYIPIKKVFNNMGFVRGMVRYSFENPSKFIWVFSNGYDYMKKEIDDCIKMILEKTQKDDTNFKLKKVSEEIKRVNETFEGLASSVRDIEKAILKQSKDVQVKDARKTSVSWEIKN